MRKPNRPRKSRLKLVAYLVAMSMLIAIVPLVSMTVATVATPLYAMGATLGGVR